MHIYKNRLQRVRYDTRRVFQSHYAYGRVRLYQFLSSIFIRLKLRFPCCFCVLFRSFFLLPITRFQAMCFFYRLRDEERPFYSVVRDPTFIRIIRSGLKMV